MQLKLTGVSLHDQHIETLVSDHLGHCPPSFASVSELALAHQNPLTLTDLSSDVLDYPESQDSTHLPLRWMDSVTMLLIIQGVAGY